MEIKQHSPEQPMGQKKKLKKKEKKTTEKKSKRKFKNILKQTKMKTHHTKIYEMLQNQF